LLSRNLRGYLVGVIAPSAATAVMVLVNHDVQVPNISLLYLPAILFVAVYFGTLPSLVAATLAVIEYDFFLLNPVYTFTISQVGDVLAFVIFLIVAILTSQLAARARGRAETAQRRATESAMLYELGQALMSAHDVSEVLEAITQQIVSVFGTNLCAIYVPDAAGPLRLAAETVLEPGRERASQATAETVYQQATQLGSSPAEQTEDGEQHVYCQLRTADRIVGVMEIGPKRSGHTLDPDERRLVTSFAAQASLVITRAQTEHERHRLSVLEESDRLKSALLSAVSHDLRTPLASIRASATSLLLADVAWTAEEGQELLQTIDHEAGRLNRLVGNLLDVSRIEAGVLRPELNWYDVDEMIDTIRPRLRPLLGERPLELEVQTGIPPIRIDLLRVEELVLNLVENAVKYTPPDTPIALSVRRDLEGLHIAVVDQGPGVPESQRKQIFDTFVQGQQHSDSGRGTGLGLAICRGIAEAHGGALAIRETPGGGATFILTLPPACIASHELAVEGPIPSSPKGDQMSVRT
jgi:two-component system sensor histidine kinase KdpD